MALKFAANLTLLFSDSPFLERFARARAAGFRYVEFQFPYEHDLTAIARALDENALELVLFNLPAGAWNAGERGLAALPQRVQEFRASVTQALGAAQILHAPRLNCLVGNRDPNFALADQERVLIENLRYAARVFGEHEIALGIEHLNAYDVPNYLQATPASAFAIQAQADAPNLTVQYDVYHAQRAEGELVNTLQQNLARIGHIQIADTPGRHQPGTGEINYAFVLNALEHAGYKNFVGLEYVPTGAPENWFGWIAEYGFALR